MKLKLMASLTIILVLTVTGLTIFFNHAVADEVEDPGSPSGDGIQPVFLTDNPTCTDLGYDFGFKPQPEPPPDGVYTFPDSVHTVTITTDGTYFDWVADLGIDAVSVKGGNNANLYVYDPPAEDTGDTDLHAPINPYTVRPYEISHINFCYDYEVTVTKTADTTFTRTWNWTITKSASPERWSLFSGDSGISEYTVSVEKTGYTDSDWAVSGTITIENDTPYAATIVSVIDEISGIGTVTVDCDDSFPKTLAAWSTLTCTYSSTLPDGESRTNTATVTTSGLVGGGEDSADIIFGDPTTVVNDTIHVSDTNGGEWEFSDSDSVTYTRTFTCNDDDGTHENTATIEETGQSDDASVMITCYELEVTKDASTSFTRTWEWSINKSADQTDLILSPGQQFTVQYSITVDASATDSNWVVSGNITVKNPAPIDATINNVLDVVSPDLSANVLCGVTFPYILESGMTLNCSYNASPPDDSSRTNTVTATLRNHTYDSDGSATPSSSTTDFTDSADVDFGNATMNEIDECVDVTDTYAGNLGTVCAGDAPKKFNYSRVIGPFSSPEDCGENQVVNTAEFATNDTGTEGRDAWTVTVTVPCDFGCTLTPGYWKTHSKNGPAPYDDTWALVGEDTIFYGSGKSWYQALWTTPQGNAYWILAHAYIAAYLNGLNGADISAVMDAMASAVTLFNTYTPESRLSKAVRQQFINIATALDQFNNGYIGPGHCSE